MPPWGRCAQAATSCAGHASPHALVERVGCEIRAARPSDGVEVGPREDEAEVPAVQRAVDGLEGVDANLGGPVGMAGVGNAAGRGRQITS
jgi:hypothetical protein